MDNQTAPRYLVDFPDGTLGTGIYALREEGLARLREQGYEGTGIRQFRTRLGNSLFKYFVPNISYFNAVDAGNQEFVVAYKWIPNSLANPLILQVTKCAQSPCVRNCEGACHCIQNRCE